VDKPLLKGTVLYLTLIIYNTVRPRTFSGGVKGAVRLANRAGGRYCAEGQ
jgi:hypothetical protein